MIINNINGNMYIGQSKNVFTRWNKHYKDAMLNKPNDNSILHKAIRKYGIKCFYFKILELCEEKDLDLKEKFYISLYQTEEKYGNYNILPGGSGGYGSGSKNHNSKLKESDVYEIREQYKELKNWKDAYEKYKDIVSINTFKDVWVGKTWKQIHYDVYTKENKLKQRNNYDRIKSHKWRQVLSDEEIIFIRKMRKKGLKPKYVYDTYFSTINRNTFNDIWYYHTFKHLIVKDDDGNESNG